MKHDVAHMVNGFLRIVGDILPVVVCRWVVVATWMLLVLWKWLPLSLEVSSSAVERGPGRCDAGAAVIFGEALAPTRRNYGAVTVLLFASPVIAGHLLVPIGRRRRGAVEVGDGPSGPPVLLLLLPGWRR